MKNPSVLPLELPDIVINPNGWGPTSFQNDFKAMEYSAYSKSDKIGKVADFIGKEHAKVTGKTYGQYRETAEDASEKFNLVDTGPTRTTRTPTFRGRWHRRRNQPVRRTEPSNKKELKGKQLKYIAQHTRRGKQWRRPKNTGYRRRNNKHAEASVKISADWEVIEQFELNVLTKMQIQPPNGEDLKMFGSLCYYNDAFDKITTRTSEKLDTNKFLPRVFPSTTTSDDPTLIDFAREAVQGRTDDKAFVFCTDELLAQIMVSTRSGFPWDVTMTRLDNNIVLIDKREESKLHLETVNETASPLTEEEEEALAEYNKKQQLSEEATNINQVFRQQCLKYAKRKTFSKENPLLDVDSEDEEEDMDRAFLEARKNLSVAYRYRKFDLGSVEVFARTEVHAICKEGGKKKYATVYSFNEWDSRAAQGADWRPKIDNQRGGIIATELKNNAYKIGKWTAKTLLAGAETMRLGFVSRKNKTDYKNHVVLAAQQFDPNFLASQINLSKKNMWGIFKTIIDIVLKQETGKYVLLKDPNRPVLRLYKLPIDEEVEGNEDEADFEDSGEN